MGLVAIDVASPIPALAFLIFQGISALVSEEH